MVLRPGTPLFRDRHEKADARTAEHAFVFFFVLKPQSKKIGRKGKRMFSRVSSFAVALALIGFVAGCSESPRTSYDAAVASLEMARSAEAEQYAPEAFKEAADSLNAALLKMQEQDGRFFAVRDYDEAAALVEQSQQLADAVRQKAVAEKELVRVGDSVMIDEIGLLISGARASLASAPKGKGSRIDLKVLEADLNAADTALINATSEYQAGRYLAARDQLTAVKAQVDRVRQEVITASSKLVKK